MIFSLDWTHFQDVILVQNMSFILQYSLFFILHYLLRHVNLLRIPFGGGNLTQSWVDEVTPWRHRKKKLLSLFVYIVYIHLRQFPWKSCLGRQKLVLMFEQRKCRRHRYVLEHYKDFDICWSGWESDNSRHDFNICIREGGVHISTV